MKKGFIFLIIAIILIIVGISIYYFGFHETEEDMRKTIENAFYEDQFLEGCKLNSYSGFDSRQDCEDAVRCTSVEMAELVRQEDLKEMSDKMKWSDDAEHTMVVYTSETLNMEHKEIESLLFYCLEKYGYNRSAIQ